MHITLKEALLGFSKSVMQLDQSEVMVERTEITKPFQVLTMKGDGMPHFEFPSERGDMLVKIIVDFPKQLSQAQKDAVATLLQ
jgi:DnaJ-class molecular chaperone